MESSRRDFIRKMAVAWAAAVVTPTLFIKNSSADTFNQKILKLPGEKLLVDFAVPDAVLW